MTSQSRREEDHPRVTGLLSKDIRFHPGPELVNSFALVSKLACLPL
jgi:hypothetical protein